MSLIHRDSRFSLEDNWKLAIETAIEEGKSRGLEINPITIFNAEGGIAGWKLHGWKSPPAVTLYVVEKNE